MSWLDSITDSTDMNLSKLWEIVEDRGAWCTTLHGVTKSRTQLSNWQQQQLHFNCFSSVQSLSRVSLRPHELQHARPPYPSPTPRTYPNSCPLSQWCQRWMASHPLLSPSPPASIFPSIRIFSNESALWSGGQSIWASASTSFLPMNTQDWFPLGWTGGITLQSKGLSRVFSNATVQKHQFFCTQFSL